MQNQLTTERGSKWNRIGGWEVSNGVCNWFRFSFGPLSAVEILSESFFRGVWLLF